MSPGVAVENDSGETASALPGGLQRRQVHRVSSIDRPSNPIPLVTPVEGFVRPGLVYVDDSEMSLQTLRRALYPRGLLLETFSSLELLRPRLAAPIIAAVLDDDLGDGTRGPDVATAILGAHPHCAIAFFSAGADPARVAELNRLGRFFDKGQGHSLIAEWIVEQWHLVQRAALNVG